MNKLTMKIFMLAGLLFTSLSIKTQTVAEIFNAFSVQDFEAIKGYMDNSLDVCIADVQQYNKKDVAISRLKEYFANNPIVKLDTKHQGESKKSNSKFHIAKLYTKNGVMRLFIYLENGTPKNLLKEIRIEKF